MPSPFDQLVGDDAFGGPGRPSARPTITRTPPRSRERRTTIEGGFGSLFFPSAAQAQGEQRGAFQEEFLAQIKAGIPPVQAIVDAALRVPGVLEDPNFPKSAQEIAKLFTQPAGEFGTVSPGASTFNKGTGVIGAQAPGKPPEPTAAQKIVDAILVSKNPEERALLLRSLPGTDGRLNVTDYLKLAAGGIPVDPKLLPKGITRPATPEEAEIALTLGTATGPRAPNTTDMLLRAMGIDAPGSPLNQLPKEAVRGGLLIAEQLRRAEAKPGPLDAILAASPEAKAAGLTPESGGGLADLFEKLDKAEAAESAAGQLDPGAPARGQVPIFGDAPQVGGTGGQAPGPGGSAALTPEQLKSVEKMPVENFAELSRETIDQIIRAVTSGKIKLSDEQRAALLAASQASQASQGGAGGGAQ